MRIGNREVGAGGKVLVVAELSGEHRGDYKKAEQLVRVAAWAGADAVKSQVFTPEAMTLDSDAAPFRLTWQGQETTLFRLYQQTAMPLEWHAPLKQLAESLGLLYFGSVFDQAGIDLMVSLGAPCLKVASFEATDTPLLRACNTTGLPVLASIGMVTVDEFEDVLDALDDSRHHHGLVVLRCTSAYPAGVQDARLQWLASNREWLNVGLSDHSRSNAVVAAAVALGACVVERHLTLNRSAGGPDAGHSDEPAEFKAMVQTIRETEAALGTVHYGPTESELPMLRFRRSLWVVRDIKAGEALTEENVRCLRPADGLSPTELPNVLGKKARVAIPRATPLNWEMIDV